MVARKPIRRRRRKPSASRKTTRKRVGRTRVPTRTQSKIVDFKLGRFIADGRGGAMDNVKKYYEMCSKKTGKCDQLVLVGKDLSEDYQKGLMAWKRVPSCVLHPLKYWKMGVKDDAIIYPKISEWLGNRSTIRGEEIISIFNKIRLVNQKGFFQGDVSLENLFKLPNGNIVFGGWSESRYSGKKEIHDWDLEPIVETFLWNKIPVPKWVANEIPTNLFDELGWTGDTQSESYFRGKVFKFVH